MPPESIKGVSVVRRSVDARKRASSTGLHNTGHGNGNGNGKGTPRNSNRNRAGMGMGSGSGRGKFGRDRKRNPNQRPGAPFTPFTPPPPPPPVETNINIKLVYNVRVELDDAEQVLHCTLHWLTTNACKPIVS